MGLKKLRDVVVHEAEAFFETYRPDAASASLAAAVEALKEHKRNDAPAVARPTTLDKLRTIASQVQNLLTAANHLRGGGEIGKPGLNVGNVGVLDMHGNVLVPFGLTGCGTVFHCAMSKREARQLALKLLQATTE